MTLFSTLTLFLAVSTANAHRLGSRTRRQQGCQRDPCVYFKDFPDILETEFRCTSAGDCELQCLYDGTSSFVCEEDLIGTAVDVCSLECVTNGREECWDNKMCLPLSTVFKDVVAGGCMGPDVCQGGECRYNGTAKTLMCDTSNACRSSEGLNTCCELPCVEPDSPTIPSFGEVRTVTAPPAVVCESIKMCYQISEIPESVNKEACRGPDDCAGECRYNTDANALQCDDGTLLCQYVCVEPDAGAIPIT